MAGRHRADVRSGTCMRAVEARGSAGACANEVARRGLDGESGFLSNFGDGGRRQLQLTNPDDHDRYVEVVGGYAEFFIPCRCDFIGAALPLRRDRIAEPPWFLARVYDESAIGAKRQAWHRYRVARRHGGQKRARCAAMNA